jgi:hypothetical protein
MELQRRLRIQQPCTKRRSHFEFSLCLSRACLGKMFVFISKWRKKWRFSHRCLQQVSPLQENALSHLIF